MCRSSTTHRRSTNSSRYLPAAPDDRQGRGAHGWTDYQRRIIWVDSEYDEAERVRVLAHEVLGHVRCDHETREIGRAQRETEADSVAYIVLHALGPDISSSSVDYVAGWAGDVVETLVEVLRGAAEIVRRVAVEALAEFDDL